MYKKTLIAALAALTVAAISIPAAASTFTSPDGIISIDLPNDNWAQIQDPAKWVVLSDGSNVITVEHFSNGEKLPDIAVADSSYVDAVTAAFSTKNEVFVANGLIVNPEVVNDITKSLLSIKIQKYDTKTAITNNTADANAFTIAPRDQTMYVNVSNDPLTVRSAFTVDSPQIGSLPRGTAVHVTGTVLKNGMDIGWYQIDYNNSQGFVSAAYLSTTQPAPTQSAPASSSSGKTGGSQNTPAPNTGSSTPATSVPDLSEQTETLLVYSQGSGRPVNITGSGNLFFDGEGNKYYPLGGGNFYDDYGAYYSTTKPASAPDSEVIGLVSEGSGRPVTIMEDSDGTLRDEEGKEYEEQEDGTFVNEDGDVYDLSGTSED